MNGIEAIPFFTDNNVPDSVGDAIAAAGHHLIRLRDVMLKDTKDPIIAVACAEHGHVLVSADNDFKAIAKRLQITQSQYQKHLHRVDLRCFEPDSAKRFSQAMSLIEHEWMVAHHQGHSMVIEIKDTVIRILR